MKIVKQSLNVVLIATVLIIMSLSLAACSKDSNPSAPVITNISGKWDGQISHPDYTGGSLNMTILQNDNNISGSFTMRLVRKLDNGRNFVQSYGGTVAGTKISDQKYTLTLTGPNFTWICSMQLSSITLSGSWESSISSLSGTISVEKN